MPLLSRMMIRIAFLNLWVGFGIATLILSYKGHPELFPAYTWQWIPAHVNLLLIGWMVQLALGVAYWILPRLYMQGSERGRIRFAVTAPILINTGVWLHVITALIAPWNNDMMTLLPAGLFLQLLGVIAFAIHAYPRIRPMFL